MKLRPGARQVTACAAPSGTTPVVRANGDVYLCIYLVGQEKNRFGTLDGAWDQKHLEGMTEALHVDNVAGCDHCAWRYACGGGCPVVKLAPLSDAGAHAKAIDYSRKINCDFTQAVLAELLWDMADDVRRGTEAAPNPAERPLFC